MLKRIAVVPNPPIVRIAFKLVAFVATAVFWRAFPIANFWAQTINHPRQNMIENGMIVCPYFLSLFLCFIVLPAPALPTFTILIIAAPKCDTWVVSQTFYVVNCFLFYVFQKSRIARIHRASEHKILPNQNSIFIA